MKNIIIASLLIFGAVCAASAAETPEKNTEEVYAALKAFRDCRTSLMHYHEIQKAALALTENFNADLAGMSKKERKAAIAGNLKALTKYHKQMAEELRRHHEMLEKTRLLAKYMTVDEMWKITDTLDDIIAKREAAGKTGTDTEGAELNTVEVSTTAANGNEVGLLAGGEVSAHGKNGE